MQQTFMFSHLRSRECARLRTIAESPCSETPSRSPGPCSSCTPCCGDGAELGNGRTRTRATPCEPASANSAIRCVRGRSRVGPRQRHPRQLTPRETMPHDRGPSERAAADPDTAVCAGPQHTGSVSGTRWRPRHDPTTPSGARHDDTAIFVSMPTAVVGRRRRWPQLRTPPTCRRVSPRRLIVMDRPLPSRGRRR